MMSYSSTFLRAAVWNACRSRTRSSGVRTIGLSASTFSPASIERTMYSVFRALLPAMTTRFPARSAIIRSRKSLPVYVFSTQRVGWSPRLLKVSMRARCCARSSPPAEYTCTTLSTSGYMNFCTSEAWKCPGSSVSRRKRAESARGVACCATCCAEAGTVMTASAARAETARRRAWSDGCMLSGGGLVLGEPDRAVRRALWAREECVGLGVVHEALGLRVPGERPVELHRRPAQDARRVAAVHDRRRRERLPPRLHALEPILV